MDKPEKKIIKLFGIAIAVCLLIVYINYAQDRNHTWILIGKNEDTSSSFFILKGSVKENTYIIKAVDVNGTSISRWECDCYQKKTRMLSWGISLDSMKAVKGDWIIPDSVSVTKYMIDLMCKE